MYLFVGPQAECPSASLHPEALHLDPDEGLTKSNGSAWVDVPLGGQGGPVDWADIQNKPSSFTPSTHSHAIGDSTGLQAALDGKAASSHTHTASQITDFNAAGDARWAPIGGGGGGDTVVKITADQASVVTALANTTGLSFAVTSGTYYRFTGLIVFRTAATTTGLRLGLTCPAFTVMTARVEIPSAADAASGDWQGWVTSSGDSVVGPGVQAANTDYLAKIEGIILPSANGTVQLQHATEIAASAATVRPGSHIAYRSI